MYMGHFMGDLQSTFFFDEIFFLPSLKIISSARVTFYIQNCFYSELLQKKKFPECQT